MSKSLAKSHPDSFPLGEYESAIISLNANPRDRTAQHQAVLSLARLGAVDFALEEYERYSLGSVQNDEDIIALKGRLLKDLYIRSSNDAVLARQSADQYDLAFTNTGGFYSAINAATMGYLAGDSHTETQRRCHDILDLLPLQSDLEADQYYFVEATRAEAYLLLGDAIRAERSLQRAFKFDPLNYTAQAATLRQFGLITQKQDRPSVWLNNFNAPATLQFAGHLWAEDTELDISNLRENISDLIQRHDIGFAYGALAAGSDIIFAEACLEEGVALYITLPLPLGDFEKQCVAPFGEDWLARFHRCLEQAASVTYIYETQHVLTSEENFLLAADISMGQAILRAKDYERPPHQFLLQDSKRTTSHTTHVGHSWRQTGFDQTIIPINLPNKASGRSPSKTVDLTLDLFSTDGTKKIITLSRRGLIETILKLSQETKNGNLALALSTNEIALPNPLIKDSLFITEPLAALFALEMAPEDKLEYAGMTTVNQSKTHWYRLKTS